MTNKKEKPKKWVIMIYACANDKNSEGGLKKFLKELNETGKIFDNKKDGVEIKILLHAYCDWDKSEKKKYYAKRFEVKSNFLKTPEAKADKDVVYTKLYSNMGDPNALSDFIEWSKKIYEADHYLLLLWGHGAQYGMFTGELARPEDKLREPWRFKMFSEGKKVPYINAIKPVRKTIAEQYGIREKLKVEFRSKKRKDKVETDWIDRKIINNGLSGINGNPVLPPTVIYYFDVEKNNLADKLTQLIPKKPTADSLTIEEICKSLWDTGHYIKGAGNIEIVMIFGCAMQTFELAYELSKCGKLGCKYLIASEELIYWEGYDYKTSFTRLLYNPDMSAEELSRHIIIDAKEKKPKSGSKDDGHKDKESWAISCVEIQKCTKVAKCLDKIGGAINELSEYKIKGVNKNMRMNWVTEFRRILLIARAHCCHFGEDAFVESYIDIAWFFKVFKELVSREPFLIYGTRIGPRAERTYKKYQSLIKELKTVIKLINETIVKSWIGSKRSEEGYLSKKIYRKDRFKFTLKQSWGGQGLAIYFPLSRKVLKSDVNQEKLFFQRKTDYNLEFMKNKWQIMNMGYMKRNEKISAIFWYDNKKYIKGVFTKPRLAEKGQVLDWAIQST